MQPSFFYFFTGFDDEMVFLRRRYRLIRQIMIS